MKIHIGQNNSFSNYCMQGSPLLLWLLLLHTRARYNTANVVVVFIVVEVVSAGLQGPGPGVLHNPTVALHELHIVKRGVRVAGELSRGPVTVRSAG